MWLMDAHTTKTKKPSQARMPRGVLFEPDVLDYLERLTQETGQSRNWVMNAAIREHARLSKEKLGESRLLFNPKELAIQF